MNKVVIRAEREAVSRAYNQPFGRNVTVNSRFEAVLIAVILEASYRESLPLSKSSGEDVI